MARKKNTDSAKLGVIYARYSSHAQRDASIEQQVAECQAYATAHGITILDIYADRAISGKSDQRPAFQKMMRDAGKGRFQYVVAWKSNRIGRNMMQAMVNEARLSDYGVRCLYTEEDFDDTAAGRFALRSMMNVNQFYSENMAEDIMRGMKNNAEKCMVNGPLPLGYKKGEDSRYAIDEPNAAIVQEIFSRVLCGENLADIASSLNIRGIRTSKGAEWNKGSFHSILANERYRGIYIYGDIRIEGGIPRIISDDLFFRVQEVLKMKSNPTGNIRRRGTADYLLTGKLYCGKCKSPMVGVSGTSPHGEKAAYYYYSCNGKRLNHTCDKANIPRDLIEDTVAAAIVDYALQDDVIETIADRTVEYCKRAEADSDVPILEAALHDTQRGIKNLMSAIEAGIITATTKDRLIELEGEQARLTSQLTAAKANIVTVSKSDLMAALTLFRDGDVKDKRFQSKIFDTFLVAVYLYDNELTLIFSFAGADKNLTIPIDPAVFENLASGDAVCINTPEVHQQKSLFCPLDKRDFFE